MSIFTGDLDHEQKYADGSATRVVELNVDTVGSTIRAFERIPCEKRRNCLLQQVYAIGKTRHLSYEAPGKHDISASGLLFALVNARNHLLFVMSRNNGISTPFLVLDYPGYTSGFAAFVIPEGQGVGREDYGYPDAGGFFALLRRSLDHLHSLKAKAYKDTPIPLGDFRGPREAVAWFDRNNQAQGVLEALPVYDKAFYVSMPTGRTRKPVAACGITLMYTHADNPEVHHSFFPQCENFEEACRALQAKYPKQTLHHVGWVRGRVNYASTHPRYAA